MNKTLLGFIMVLMASCVSHNYEDYYGLSECEIDEATFSEDIAPIVAANCAISGCHVSGTGLPDFTQFNNFASRASLVKFRTANGIMPPPASGKSLTADEINKIGCWVDSGAKNN